jgi:protein-S-isoprenylcysteine O-methyltransferase Ste14
MPATAFEFRWRFFLIGGAFGLGFFLYAVDPRNAGVALVAALGAAGDRALLRTIFVTGAIVATLAALLRTWASAYLSGAVVHDRDLHSGRLVADGPYRHVRNPLYVGIFLLGVGEAPIASRLGGLVMVSALGLVCWRLIGREEAELAARLGEAYRAYTARVPRLWPAIAPRVGGAGHRPDWRDGIVTELYFWAFAIASWVFAWTLDGGDFLRITAVGIAVYWPVALLQKRRAARG